ncbi:MAG: GH3 auxin-responsive promoter family protein, partial [Verrucomicrobiota bacterium]
MRQLITPALAPLLNHGARLIVHRFARLDPLATQRKLFFHLLRSGSATRFGADHAFASLARNPFEHAYDLYRRTVPIRSYADFWRDYFSSGYTAGSKSPRLELNNVTWPGQVRLFCETSGTTAPTKYIPFTPEMFAANRRAARDLVAHYLAAVPRNRLFRGRFLYLSGSTALSSLGPGIESGDMSAITLR